MECLKNAVIAPLIKEMDGMMDKDVYKNYRPVSNLKFAAKTLERGFCKILTDHHEKINLLEELHSTCRKCHSTKTALVKVASAVLRAVDQNGGCILVLLDLSATLDTIDHEKLLYIMETYSCITGDTLQWVRFYLTHILRQLSWVTVLQRIDHKITMLAW